MWDEDTVVVEKVEQEKHTQQSSYTENYRQLRNTKRRRNSLPQGKAPRKVCPQNTHTITLDRQNRL